MFYSLMLNVKNLFSLDSTLSWPLNHRLQNEFDFNHCGSIASAAPSSIRRPRGSDIDCFAKLKAAILGLGKR